MPFQTNSGQAGAGRSCNCHDLARDGNDSSADSDIVAHGNAAANGDTFAHSDTSAAHGDTDPSANRDAHADADRVTGRYCHAGTHSDAGCCHREGEC